MRIATFNMHHGGKQYSWSKLVEATAAELVFAQEARNPAGSLAAKSGSPTHHGTAWVGLQTLKGSRWGSAMLTTSGAIEPIPVSGFEGWVVGGRWTLGATEILAFSVHLPPRSASEYRGAPDQPRGASPYVRAGNQLVDELGRIARGTARGTPHLPIPPVILGGDWNLTVGRRCSTERVNDRGEIELLDRLERELGVVSAWPAFHSGLPLAQTLRWKRNPLTSFHCDGIFLPKEWVPRILSVDILAGEDWDRLSDHNPVVVEMDVSGL